MRVYGYVLEICHRFTRGNGVETVSWYEHWNKKVYPTEEVAAQAAKDSGVKEYRVTPVYVQHAPVRPKLGVVCKNSKQGMAAMKAYMEHYDISMDDVTLIKSERDLMGLNLFAVYPAADADDTVIDAAMRNVYRFYKRHGIILPVGKP